MTLSRPPIPPPPHPSSSFTYFHPRASGLTASCRYGRDGEKRKRGRWRELLTDARGLRRSRPAGGDIFVIFLFGQELREAFCLFLFCLAK